MRFNSKFASHCLVALSTIGCWRDSNTPTPLPAVEFETGPELSFISEGNKVFISTMDSATSSNIDLPDDVPLFRSGHVILAARSPEGEFIEYTTVEPGHTVRQFYVDELTSRGWELGSAKSSNSTHELAATKADRSLHILIDLSGTGGAGAQVTLAHKGGAG